MIFCGTHWLFTLPKSEAAPISEYLGSTLLLSVGRGEQEQSKRVRRRMGIIASTQPLCSCCSTFLGLIVELALALECQNLHNPHILQILQMSQV